jgi:uncharacterized protein
MKINIRDLDDGIHEVAGVIKPGEIDLAEPEFYPEDLRIQAIVDRLEDIFRIKIRISTKARYVCDRCLTDFQHDFDDLYEQIYQIGSGTLDEDDEVEFLPENATEIDISKAIRDAIILARPMQLLCSEGCKGLCPNCGTDLNQKTCTCAGERIDPRLAKLKSLLS